MKVLIVDDDKFEREGLLFLLKKLAQDPAIQLPEAIEAQDAKNAYVALDLMEKEHFDIVISDIKMPNMDGLAFLRKLKERNCTSICIIYSGYSDFSYAKEAISLNVLDFLVKPAVEEEFNACILKAVDQLYNQKHDTMTKLLYALVLGESLSTEEYLEGFRLPSGRLLYMRSQATPAAKPQFELPSLLLDDSHIYHGSISEAEKLLYVRSSIGRAELEAHVRQAFLPDAPILCLVSEVLSNLRELGARYQELREAAEGLITRDSFAILDIRSYRERSFALQNLDVLQNSVLRHGTGDFTLEVLLGTLQRYTREQTFLSKDMRAVMIGAIADYAAQVGMRDADDYAKKLEGARSFDELEHALAASSGDDDIVHMLKDYIAKSYHKDITVEDLARVVNLSQPYVCALFKKQTGETLVEYITSYRIERAKKLLQRKELRIVDIAHMVGYKNPSYFNMIFKKHTQMTPREMRKELLY